jgi:integrase
MSMTWVKRWGYEMAETAARPGIYRLRSGGFFVRARVNDRTGKRRELTAALREAKTPKEAQATLDELVADARAERQGKVRTKQRWSDFAVSRLQERIRRGRVGSEATVDRWKEAIALFDPEWGTLDVRDVSRAHIERWLNTTVASWMTSGKTVLRKRRVEGKLSQVEVTTVIKATTVNGWLRVLRALCHAAKVKFDLPKSAFEGVEFFDEGRIYTTEEPNALPPEVLPAFMALARKKFPQHFAMILLGFVTGLRPSSLRPLRRKGKEADINWETGVLQIRRSHSRRQHVMNRTKTKKDNAIALPKSVLDVLEEHVESLKGKMAESDLLFPSDLGGLRTRNVLAKPFEAIGRELGLKYRLTPRGMRRTFNDVARAAGIHDVVTRSISGHQTESMQVHYSTAADAEKRDALSRVHAVTTGQAPNSDHPQGVGKGVGDANAK